MSCVCGALLSARAVLEPVDARHQDVEHDHVGLARRDASRGHRRTVGLVELEIEDLERGAKQFP